MQTPHPRVRPYTTSPVCYHVRVRWIMETPNNHACTKHIIVFKVLKLDTIQKQKEEEEKEEEEEEKKTKKKYVQFRAMPQATESLFFSVFSYKITQWIIPFLSQGWFLVLVLNRSGQ